MKTRTTLLPLAASHSFARTRDEKKDGVINVDIIGPRRNAERVINVDIIGPC